MFKIRLSKYVAINITLQPNLDVAKAIVDIWANKQVGLSRPGAGGFRIRRLTVTWLVSRPAWLRRARAKAFALRWRVTEQLATWRKLLRSYPLVRLLLGLRYSVAVYEVDRAYGGPEEGGWWYDCGDLVRVAKRFRSEDDAWDYCNRLNEKLYSRMEHYGIRSSSSAAYSGGEYRAKVYESAAPESFPVERPYWD